MARPTNAVSEETLRQLAEEFRIWRQETLHGPAAVDDATLAAYVSGTLDEARQRQVEERLAASPDLAEMARAVRETLEEDDWRTEGADLAPRLRLPLVVSPGAPAVERPAPVRPIWRVPRWAAAAVLAATLLLGIQHRVAGRPIRCDARLGDHEFRSGRSQQGPLQSQGQREAVSVSRGHW